MKKNNGFSLVELIIVIAIMAILATVIAPALIRFIDKSRKADDVAAASVISDAFNAALAEETVYEALTAKISADGTTAGGFYPVVLGCASGDNEWTIRDGYDSVIKEVMDKSCPPPVVKYKKEIDPASSGTSIVSYITSWSKFTPAGWGVALVKNKPCVLITDGTTDPATPPNGISLNPIMCVDYK